MKKVMLGAALSALCCGPLAAAPVVAHSAQSITELANSSGTYTTYGGLMKDGSSLYYGNFNTIRSYDLSSGTESVYCSIPSNADTKALASTGASMYVAMDTSYSAPYPSNLGTFDSSGYSVALNSGAAEGETTYSIYDAAVFGGSYYFSANAGVVTNASGAGYTTGTGIFRLDGSSVVEVANVGGSSGGLTFDADGNLYYASQTGDGIVRFAADDLAVGGLLLSDAETVVSVTASGVGILSDGELVATTGWGQELAGYDLVTGEKLHNIASTSGMDYMGKFVVGEDDSIYITSTDWEAYDSTLSVITVPEPSTVALLGISGVMLFAGRRRWRR